VLALVLVLVRWQSLVFHLNRMKVQVLASLELNLDNEYFVFVNDGEPLPLSG